MGAGHKHRAAKAMDAGGDPKLGGMQANMAMLTCSEAAFNACDAAIQVHGGYGLTREYDVITYVPMIRAMRIAPVNNEIVLNYLGEHFLGLGKSYR
jgi:acyl-CoA dehydrogenase